MTQGRQQFINNALCNLVMLDAKCPECGKKAQVNDEMSEVRCGNCGFSSTYDDYIETMKGKAVDIADNYQTNLDRNPF